MRLLMAISGGGQNEDKKYLHDYLKWQSLTLFKLNIIPVDELIEQFSENHF